MKNIEKYIYSLLFIVGVGALSIASIINMLPELRKTLTDISIEENMSISDLVSNKITEIDAVISENVYERHSWIEAYGTINRLLGKKEINGFDYAIDKNGAYNAVNFWNEVDDMNVQRFSQQLFMLKEDVEEQGGKLVFLGFPNKFDERWNSGYSGIPYNGFNSKMDELLLWNRRYGIDSIDFRTTLADSGLKFDEMFYKTDHHWTAYAAFLSFQELVAFLNENYEENLDENGYYRDIANYDVFWMEDIYLGSSGRNVGLEFSGQSLEDFQILKPKFHGNITWNDLTGDYNETVLVEKRLSYDSIYTCDMYSYYLSGVNVHDSIVNHENPEGIKILFIRDSFSSPLVIDMIPLASQIDCVWGKYATDSYVKKMIEDNQYDYVFVGYYTENIGVDFFQFYAEDYPEIETEEMEDDTTQKEE